jgi:hypothetical protein
MTAADLTISCKPMRAKLAPESCMANQRGGRPECKDCPKAVPGDPPAKFQNGFNSRPRDLPHNRKATPGRRKHRAKVEKPHTSESRNNETPSGRLVERFPSGRAVAVRICTTIPATIPIINRCRECRVEIHGNRYTCKPCLASNGDPKKLAAIRAKRKAGKIKQGRPAGFRGR